MIINESISGAIYCRNQVYALNNQNVISASARGLACRDGAFEIGGVYSATLSITCRLKNAGTFALKGAEIELFSQYGHESEPYRIGTFWIVNVRRNGDIFTIDAQDAVGWTDVSSYNDTAQEKLQSVGFYLSEYEKQKIESTGNSPTVMEWFACLTQMCNKFLQIQTGVENMLKWQDYDDKNNLYFGNEYLWRYYDAVSFYRTEIMRPHLYLDNGYASSDCPRDFYRYLAEFTGGFVYTDPKTGYLTLGQFGMASHGIAEISLNEIEADSYDIADYTIRLSSVYARGEISTGYWASGRTYLDKPDYEKNMYIYWMTEANPFVDGFASYMSEESFDYNMIALTTSLWETFYHSHPISNDVPGIEDLRTRSKFTVRPFRCTVHAPKRFALGQQIRIHADQTYNSIITSIQWTFRGGHQLACGGEDSRVLSDSLRASKADKAIKESRNRSQSIEEKLAPLLAQPGVSPTTQADYDSLPHDSNTLYVIFG